MGTSPTAALRTALACAALVAALPAGAQMYKWVDERGQVSYSNTPPPDAAQKKIETVAERLSIYSPDDQLNRAMSAEARRDAKAATLARQIEAERNARRTPVAGYDPANRNAAYERCVAERRVDCDSIRYGTGGDVMYGYTGSYGPQFVLGARNFPPGMPFFVDPTPPPRIGISTAPPVGIDNRPPVGVDTRAPVGVQPPRNRPVGFFR